MSTPEERPVQRYVGVPLADLVAVFEVAQRRGRVPEVLEQLQRLSRENPEDELLFPEGRLHQFIGIFALFGLCSGTTGTWVPTIATVLVRAAAFGSGAGITFTYATASTDPPCKVWVSSVTVTIAAVGPITVSGKDTPTAGGGGGTYTGTVASGAGPSSIGSPVTVTVVFSGTNRWCDTCTAAGPTTVTATTVVV